jgi:hypothetical protein
MQSVRIARTDYSEMAVCDLNGDGGDDIVVVRLATSETPGEAESLTLMGDGEVVSSAAGLSAGMELIARIITGGCADGRSAVFVDGKVSGGYTVTDVLAWRDGLVNISLDTAAGYSSDTLRAVTMYSTDINKDGAVEIPVTTPLPAQSDTTYYGIGWYAYDSSGGRKLAMSTYHNNYDGWYMIIPESWLGRFTVRRDDSTPGERTLIFSYVRAGPAGGEYRFEDCLKVYALSGDNKEERSRLPGRFVIMTEGNAVYAGQILPGAEQYGFADGPEDIIAGFRLIYSEWLAGSA